MRGGEKWGVKEKNHREGKGGEKNEGRQVKVMKKGQCRMKGRTETLSEPTKKKKERKKKNY